MKKARMIGNYVGYVAQDKHLSISQLGETLQLDEEHVKSFLRGRLLLSFEQLHRLSKELDVSVENLLKGDEKVYNSTVVHCMHKFDDNDNREKILDIIDSYLDVVEAVNQSINQ